MGNNDIDSDVTLTNIALICSSVSIMSRSCREAESPVTSRVQSTSSVSSRASVRVSSIVRDSQLVDSYMEEHVV